MFWLILSGIGFLYALAVLFKFGPIRSLKLICGCSAGAFLPGILILLFPNQKITLLIRILADFILLVALGLELFVLNGAIKGRQAAVFEKDSSSDVTIVLGCGLKKGNVITTTLTERLTLAKSLYKGEKIVLSGGKTQHETIEEAKVMSLWMENHGIPKDKMILEMISQNTAENLLSSKEKLSASFKKTPKVRIITSDFHCGRARKLAKSCGYQNFTVCGSKTMMLIAPLYHLRECMSLVKRFIYLVKSKITKGV